MSLDLKPGLHENISEQDYHSDNLCPEPTLSCSLAKILIGESAKHAFHQHPRLGGKTEDIDPSSKSMDYGSLGHSLLLGKGTKIEIGDWDDWKTKDARTFRANVTARGNVAVLKHTYARAVVMTASAMDELERFGLRQTFDQAKKEVTALWQEGDIWLRSKLDAIWVGETAEIYDIKITERANPEAIERQIGVMHYDLQDVWYTSAIEKIFPELAGKVRFTFLFVESEFPFCVVPMRLSGELHALGEMKFSRAKRMWDHARKSGKWPGYASEVLTAHPKPWDLAREMERAETTTA